MGGTTRQIIAGIAASACLGGLVLGTNYLFWFNLIISAAVGLGTYFSLPGRRLDGRLSAEDMETRDRLLELLEKTMRRFSGMAAQCGNSEMSATIRDMADTTKKIAGGIREDPEMLFHGSQMLDQYLIRSEELVSGYVRLSSDKSLGTGTNDTLADIENTIRKIRDGLKEIYRKMREKDLMELEASSAGIQAILEIEMPHLDSVNTSNKRSES